jgi:hypothetical protein
MLYGMSLKRSELGVFLGTKTITDDYRRDDTYNVFWNVVVRWESQTYPWRDFLKRVPLPEDNQ